MNIDQLFHCAPSSPVDEQTLATTRSKRYQDLKALTCTICNLDITNTFQNDNPQMLLSDLLTIWNSNAVKLGCTDVISETLHHMVLGKYLNPHIPAMTQQLFELIELVLIDDTTDTEVLDNTINFNNSIKDLCEAHCNSQKFTKLFFEYRYAKAAMLIINKGRTMKQLSSDEILTWNFYHKLLSHEFVEAIICRLLPEAVNWSIEWADQHYIFQRLQAVHGVDYTNDPEDFDNLITAVIKFFCRESCLSAVLNIKVFPSSMIEAIWCNDPEEEVIRIFRQLVSKCRYVAKTTKHYTIFTKSNLKSSWLYTYVEDLMNQGFYDAQKAISVFNTL